MDKIEEVKRILDDFAQWLKDIKEPDAFGKYNESRGAVAFRICALFEQPEPTATQQQEVGPRPNSGYHSSPEAIRKAEEAEHGQAS